MNYQEVVIKAGFQPLRKVQDKSGDILLGERHADPAKHDNEFLIETIWLVTDGLIQVGRTVFHQFSVPQPTRIAAAIADAQKTLRIARDNQ